MKREVKQAVALELLGAAGDLIEFWTEHFEIRGQEPPCDAEEARKCIALWLHKLPGDSWDIRLGDID